jgi:hypothetical protein
MWKARTPSGAQLLAIERQRFLRGQVNRDRIGAEGVDDQDVEACVLLARHLQSRVADHECGTATRNPQIGEVGGIAGDALDGWVDLEERPLLVRCA